MPSIHYEGQSFVLAAGETVLDCMLRNSLPVSYSCKAGSCQSCVVKGRPGEAPEAAQRGLKDTLRAQGYFLACSCQPDSDLTMTAAGNDHRTHAQIGGMELLNDSVLRVRLRTDSPFEYFAGQFVSLFREDGVARSYSLASLPHETELELHVRKIPGGAMSQWLHGTAQVGMNLWVQGPAGNCFYTSGNAAQPLLLAGAGTGLAPLYGILRDALQRGHTGPVWLFQGAVASSGLYLTGPLMELERAWPNFRYVRSVIHGEEDGGGIEKGALDQCILNRFPRLAGWKGYICGDPALVNLLRRKLFLAGMASNAIYADAFLPTVA
jgi:CDP-4-dehydro-6-deoxyglucose reductase, E3